MHLRIDLRLGVLNTSLAHVRKETCLLCSLLFIECSLSLCFRGGYMRSTVSFRKILTILVLGINTFLFEELPDPSPESALQSMHSQRCFKKPWAHHSCSLNTTPQNLIHFSPQSLIWIFSTYDINGVMD